MFRMKFKSAEATSSEDEDEKTVSVQERYRERTGDAESVSCSLESAPQVVFEGRVAGKLGRIQRLASSDKIIPLDAHDCSSLRSMTLSPNDVAAAGSVKREGIDLKELEGPAQDADAATVVLDTDVLMEPVKPFAESLHVNHHSNGSITDKTPFAESLRVKHHRNGSMADKTTVVAYLHYRTPIRREDAKMVFLDAPCVLLEARTDSVRRTRSSRSDSSECSSTHANEEENEAATEMMKKLMQKGKLTQTNIRDGDDKSAKPWEEPLLATHDQEEVDLTAKEEAKVEGKRLTEEERLQRERRLRELQALANCTVSAPSPGRTFRKSKLKKIFGKTGVTGVYRFLKNPFKIFRSHKKYSEYPNARQAKVIIPKKRLFSGCRTIPSGCCIAPSETRNTQLAMTRNVPQQRITRRPNIQFTTVESTQRDVQAWTREEYLRKNGRIPERSNNKKEDEDFGGIEGNNLMNQYFDGGVVSDYDSDSD